MGADITYVTHRTSVWSVHDYIPMGGEEEIFVSVKNRWLCFLIHQKATDKSPTHGPQASTVTVLSHQQKRPTGLDSTT